MLIRSLGLALLPFAAFVTVSACSSDDDPGSSRSALAAGCNINSDCTEPLVCAFRKCHTACTETRDCPAGQRCMASDRPYHVCQLPEEQRCSYNSQCPQGQACSVDGQCRDQCSADRDCVTGQVCTSGTCAEKDELVDGGLPALPDASPGASGLPCAYDSNCARPLVCRAGLCAFECLDHRDCVGGHSCVEHECKPRTCGGRDAGVTAGEACSYTSQCPEPLVCRQGRCDCQCVDDRDCAQGETCTEDFRCVRGTGTEGDGGADASADASNDAAEAGATEMRLAKDLIGLGDIAVNDEYLFYVAQLDGKSAAVRCAKSGCKNDAVPFIIGDPPVDWAPYTTTTNDKVMFRSDFQITAVAADATTLYLALNDTGLDYGAFLGKCDIETGCETGPQQLLGDMGRVNGLAVDGTKLYFSEGTTVFSCDKGTCARSDVIGYGEGPEAIAVGGGNVYWLDPALGAGIWHCPANGCPNQSGNVVRGTDQLGVSAIATDGVRIWFGQQGEVGGFECPVSGCAGAPTRVGTFDGTPLTAASGAASTYFGVMNGNFGELWSVPKD